MKWYRVSWVDEVGRDYDNVLSVGDAQEAEDALRKFSRHRDNIRSITSVCRLGSETEKWLSTLSARVPARRGNK